MEMTSDDHEGLNETSNNPNAISEIDKSLSRGSIHEVDDPGANSDHNRASDDSKVNVTGHDEAATPPISIESIREWSERPKPNRIQDIRRFLKQCTKLSREFNNLCRQSTSNGTFEGEHSAVMTCGVTTTDAGKSIAMQSLDSDHTFGIVQDGNEFIYEGELLVNVPHGFGVGTYASGDRFIGTWINGQPCGVGKLASLSSPSSQTLGWYYGLTLMQEWRPREVVVELPKRIYLDQPGIGLFTVCRLLETSRLHQFRRALDKWGKALCLETIATAIHSRTIAYTAWANACVAQQASIRHHGLLLHSKDTNDELFNKVQALREQERLVHEKNELQEARLRHSRTTHQTTVACLGIERRSCELVQADLDEIESELRDAKAAEQRCIEIQAEYADIRHRIEEGKVKLNYMRQARRMQVTTPTTMALGRKPSISIMPTYRRRSSAKVYVDIGQHEAEIHNVCGVEGCDCRVEKDVFLPIGDPTFD